MSRKIELARAFSIYAHESVGQKRKYTGEPYWHHPQAVAEVVQSVPHTEAMVCAAWLHDVVEDTPFTIETVAAVFGEDVAALVGWLTDVSKPEDGNRIVRKAIDRHHTARAPIEAKTVKLADLIDNSKSILSHDPGFGRTYLAEKRELLEVMRDADHTLWTMAAEYAGMKA